MAYSSAAQPSATALRDPAAIARLINAIEEDDGPRAAYAALQARLRGLRERGEAVPAEFELLEKKLVADCCAESQGR